MSLSLDMVGLSLRALRHLPAILFQVFRQVTGTHAALPVARDGVINELRVRQLEISHDLPEFFQRLVCAKAQIMGCFLAIEDTRRFW
jgi:hypothetical protein